MSEDRNVRRLFEDLREEEEQAPPFGRVWLAAQERLKTRAAGSRRRWLLRTAVALSAAALLVVVLVPAPRSRESAPPFEVEEAVLALSNWQAPLDFLLESPESEMFTPEIWPSTQDLSDLTPLSMEEFL